MKRKLLTILLSFCFTQFALGQTFNEAFESISSGGAVFTNNGITFTITSQLAGPFDGQTAFPGTGWSGTAADNRYIDNDGFALNGQATGFTITANASFRFNSGYFYLADHNANNNVTGTLTIVGKLAGATKFTAISTTNFNNKTATANGFTFVNMTTFGGANNTAITIDQLVITTTTSFEYVAFDAFNFTKLVAAPTVTISSQTNLACNGISTGSASCSATGGTSPYSYSWAPSGGTAATATGLAAGTYTVSVTDAASAVGTQTVSITQPSAITSSVVSQTNVACNTGNTGAATITASGGTGTLTYNWTPGNPTGDGTVSVTGLTAGTWTCTVTDANSCTKAQAVTITAPGAITSSVTSQTNISCNGGSNGAATITAGGGAGGYTYDWTPGTPTGDGTVSVTGLTAGTWTCTITDANSCTKAQAVTITAPGAITSSVTSQTNISCNGGSNGAATITAGGGAGTLTYNWTPGNPTGDGTVSVTGLTAGTWTCTITDANSCTKAQTVTITAPSAITSSVASQTNISCNGGSNGAATITAGGGAGAYTYDWTPGTPTGDGTVSVTGLTAGTWTCTITDANSCTKAQTVTITAPSAITSSVASQTNISCNGGSNGAATITAGGGAGTLTYNWTPGTPTGDGTVSVTGLTAGTWTCTVTDANSCTKAQTVTITAPSAITSSVASQTNISCNGGSNGAATITAGGGAGAYTYDWTPGTPTGDGTVSVTGLTAGTWTCTVTDANSCTKAQTVTITAPSAITSSVASQTNISCNGGSNGAATITAGGGAGGYTYNWTPGNPTGDGTVSVSGLTAGTWTCTVTDANSCTKAQTVTITAPSAITSSISSQTNVGCGGEATGAATIAPSGGTPSYTYSWAPSGGTAATATGLMAGTYTVTITDANLCTKTQNVTITQPTVITATTSQANISCNGGANGSATITPTGGTPGYTYSWAPSGGTAATASGLTAGTYTVTITDANLCTAAKNITITQPATITATTSQTNVSCNGGTNGSATVTPSGGTPSYSYSWAPSGGTGATASGLMAGTYTVTITDANACFITKNVTITQPSALTSNISSVTHVSCNGGSNGTATISAGGGTGTYTYSWAPSGGTAATATGLSTDTYTVTITDANSCTKIQNVSIIQPSAITAATSQTNTYCNGGINGSATITPTGGTPGYTYSWAPSGGTAATASGLAAGTYTVTITDANLCTAAKNITITQPATITATTSQTNIACNSGSTGSATITPAGGTPGYTYSWAPSGGTAATATGLVAGTYTVTITDANLCTATKNVTITQPTVLTATTSQTNVSCDGLTNGSATVTPSGGTPSYTYLWASSGGTAATATGLAPGTYTVTITDANLCTTTKNITITQPTPITATTSQTNLACNGGTTGSAAVTPTGGTPGYMYSWAPSGGTAATATGLSAGTYTVTITDANLCTITKNITLTQPTALASTGSQTNLSCNGAASGSATISVTGGTPSYTYAWTPSGGTAATASGLAAGSYTATVTDANSCTTIRNFTITQPTAITATISQTNVSCNGVSDGAATITATGGTGTLTYSWAPAGGTAASATGLSAGTYTVTITDVNLCTATKNITITQPALLTSTGSQVNVSCNGGTNGSATVIASGGTAPYTYAWAPSGGTAATASGLAMGTYTVTITDAKLCVTTQTVSITQPNAITATTSQINIACNGGTTGSATVTATGGTGTYTYAWTPSGGTAATASGLAQGNYTVTIKDANNCSITQTFTITEPTAITAISTQTNVDCNGATTGSAAVTPTGGTPGYTYSWAPSGGTAASASGLVAGTYTCTIKDANNCSITKTVSITQPTLITANTAQVNVSCNGGTNGSASVTPTGGTPGYTYSWAPSGGTAAAASGLSAGTYTVTITDVNNCMLTKTVTITEPAVLVATITAQTNVSCNGGTDGSTTVTGSGGTTPYAYAWAPSGGTAATASGLAMGTYTVTITDAKLCVTTKTVFITEPTAITATTSQTNVSCNGNADGSATVTATGGTGAYTYMWAPSGGTAAIATGLAIGTYTVTIKDANNCSITKSVSIIQPALLSAITSQINVACNSDTSASASVTVSGGTSPYTYAWAPSGGIKDTATSLVAGSYTVTITDTHNCVLTKIFTITEPAAIAATTAQTNVSCNGGTNGTATVTATGGTGALSYSWAPSGGTAAAATGLSPGTYTVTITDANNCNLIKTITLTEPSAISATMAQTNVSCKGGSNGSATVTATGGTGILTYAWTPSGGTAAAATGLAAETYTCMITDANSCTIIKTVTITEPPILVATIPAHTNVSCNGGTNGAASISVGGGTTPYTYAWAPSGGTADTAKGLIAGSYTVTVTDANLCTTTQSVTITEPPVLTATNTNTGVLCHGAATGSASVMPTGGTMPYSYAWTPSGGIAATASGLVAGSYTCTITDANNCKHEEKIMITEPTELILTSIQKNVWCNGGADGNATITATGGFGVYSYSWAPSGGTAATASGLVAGTYTVTVTDGYSCIKMDTINISEPVVLSANITKTNIHCHGDSSGVAIVTPTGGTAPYTYSWKAPYTDTDSTLTRLPAGTYTCNITDAHNCTYEAKVIITEPSQLITSIIHINVSCFGGANGNAVITVGGGTAPYTYSWAPSGGTTSTASGLKAGTYTCTVNDSLGCITTQTVTITEPVRLLVSGTASPIACHGAVSTVNINATGGTSPYTGTGVFSSPAGIHTFIVSDVNSCSDSILLDIKEPAAIKGSQTISICAGDKLLIGDSTYTTSGTYMNVLKAANACDSTLTTNLTVNSVDTTVTVAVGVITSNAINSSYQWIDCSNGNSVITGATGQSYNVVKSGDYAVVVTTEKCSDTSKCTHVVATGIDPYAVTDRLNVYPNPSSGTFTIQATLAGTYTIINELGQTVRSFQLNSANNYSTTISELNNGTYYVIGISKNQLMRQKIVVVQYR